MEEFYQDPAIIQEFLTESEELLQSMDQDLVQLESSPENEELLNRIFRALHTIKGTSGFLGFDPIVQLGHRAEDVLNALRRHDFLVSRRIMDALLATRDQLGRMLADLRGGGLKPKYAIDDLITELEQVQKADASPVPDKSPSQEVAPAAEQEPASAADTAESASSQKKAALTSQTMRVDVRKLDELINLIGELVLERNRLVQLAKEVSSDAHGVDSPLTHSAARLSFITEELQAVGLRTRMVPIDAVFSKFPRIDKTMVELVSDPLVHLIRNSLDHGLELSDDRERVNKPRKGTICLEARQEGDRIIVSICDDGAGIDPARILAKAIEKGLVTAERGANLSTREILDFIFLPGFSTAEKASNVSGRGVGMDVVRSNLKKVNGSVELQSKVGKGTTVLQVAEEIYALPLRSIIETTRLSSANVHLVDGREVICLRTETLPLVRLRSLCSSPRPEAQIEEKVVVMAIAEQRIALLVDRLAGQESTVIKPLASSLHDCTGIAGATVCGDGRVRLVLDPGGLLTWAANSSAQAVLQ